MARFPDDMVLSAVLAIDHEGFQIQGYPSPVLEQAVVMGLVSRRIAGSSASYIYYDPSRYHVRDGLLCRIPGTER